MNCDVCLEGFENLQAENPFGCSKAPANQSAPILLSKTSVSIQLSWTLPAEPNGVIESFNIYRNGSIISSVSQTVTTFNDTGLNPNTAYDYQIESVNIVGSSRSDSLIVTTSESVPERVNPPMLSVINATTILAQWMPPNDTNGIIIQYKVNLIAVDGVILDEPVMKFIGNTLSAVIGDLGTFTDNMFILEACTSVGCSSSSSVSITTAEDAPEFQLPPNVTALNSTSVEISWSSPSHPNGVIIRYEIYQRLGNTDGAGMIVKTVPSNVQHSVLNGLNPYTLYEFSITSYTSFGGTASTWTQERTLEDVPEDVPDPILTVLGASEVSITWQAPSTPNGIVIQYRVFLQYLDNGTVANVANFTQVGSYNVSGLIPYTLYSFFVTACTSVGCSSSQHVVERTLESEPQNVNPISFTYSDGNLQLIWDPPVSPNGIIMSYNITRESPSLLSSPLKRDLGTPYFGTSYASFPTSNAFAGLSVKMTLYFKTLMEDGILVYLISSSKTDMFAVELRNGRPWFIFDSGSGPGVLTVDDSLSFNDGEWHYLSAEKNRLQGTLTIDGIHMITGSSMGTAQNFGTPQVYYVGGLPDGASLTTVNSNYSLEGKTFGGCLYDVRFSDIKLNYSQQLNKNSGIGLPEWGCPINLGRGISFVGGGYQSTGAFSSPGISAFSMSISVKTTSSSGLVFFSYGRDSYIIIQLEGSSLVLKTKGEGANENSLSAFSDTICDGQWHKIQIQKEEDGIILSLDGNTVILQFPGGSVNLTTNSISFIGGIPVDSNADRRYTQITSNRHVDFSGCVQNFTINDDLVNLRTDYIDQENVRMYGCEDDQSSSSCQQRITTFTIPNNSTSYTDSTTDYFTEYTYQVTAENSAGAGYSDWIRVISQSSAPQGTSLISFVNTTSTSLQMTWERPSLPNGIITQYEITTTPINNLFRKRREATLPVTTTIPIERPGQPLTTTIEGLSPATNYSVVLTASTAAASGHVSTVYVVTPEDSKTTI
jgi:usherin